MKILLVSEDLPGAHVGGLGKHVVTLANALLALGHQADILGRTDRAEGKGDPLPGFHGRLIRGFDQPHPGWKESQLGIFNPLKRPFFARRIGSAIDRLAPGYDVVHYHGHLPMVGLYLAAGINFVQTRHDQGSECLTHLRFRDGAVCTTTVPQDCSACICSRAGPLRRSVTAAAVRGYREATALAFSRQKTVFVSDFLRRQFLRAVPNADLSRSRVIHNFVDAARLWNLAATAGPPVAGQVTMAGRIDTGKGFAEFLAQAMPVLPPGARIDIVGDGPVRTAAEAAHGGQRVRFLGWREHDEAVRLTARSHVCVVPSLCEEACSTTVLEALALGRPCLALARGGTPELAVYQRYPGQLQLGADMAELAGLLASALATPPSGCPAPLSFGADVMRAVPQLLSLYAE